MEKSDTDILAEMRDAAGQPTLTGADAISMFRSACSISGKVDRDRHELARLQGELAKLQAAPAGAQVLAGEAEAAADKFRSQETRGLITEQQCNELLGSLTQDGRPNPAMLASGPGGSPPAWRVVARVLELNGARGAGGGSVSLIGGMTAAEIEAAERDGAERARRLNG